MPATSSTDFYRRPYLTTATFALALLLFLLPFFDIQCNNISMARLSGLDMATGGRPSLSKEMRDVQRGFPDSRMGGGTITEKKEGAEGKFFVTAMIALAMGIAGIVLSLINKGRNQRTGMLVGIAGAVALLGSWIQVSSFVKENARPQRGVEMMDTPFSSMVKVSASPTFWFILCLLCFLAAAFFSFKLSQPIAEKDAPPQAAPQLDIKNPGDQSEFPAAPQGERDLG